MTENVQFTYTDNHIKKEFHGVKFDIAAHLALYDNRDPHNAAHYVNITASLAGYHAQIEGLFEDDALKHLDKFTDTARDLIEFECDTDEYAIYGRNEDNYQVIDRLDNALINLGFDIANEFFKVAMSDAVMLKDVIRIDRIAESDAQIDSHIYVFNVPGASGDIGFNIVSAHEDMTFSSNFTVSDDDYKNRKIFAKTLDKHLIGTFNQNVQTGVQITRAFRDYNEAMSDLMADIGYRVLQSIQFKESV